MKLILYSKTGDGCWIGAVLAKHHDVIWTLKDEKYVDTLKGIVAPPTQSLSEADIDEADLVVFDDSDHGELADAIREHTPVIGSSVLADKLEHDRLFGIEAMEKCGIAVPGYEVFSDIAPAIDWLKKNKVRAVFKPFGSATDAATTYVSKSPDDMISYLEKLTAKAKVKEFLLQEFVEGTEVSTEAWFNGEAFYGLDHTLEEKKFMSGGVGPNTGCSGNVVWMPDSTNALFERGLRRAAAFLGASGFVGPIDLNTIVTDKECYGLEWTPRFGYEGTCNLISLLPMEFGDFMYKIATGEALELGKPKTAFAASIRIAVPPYPNPSDPKKFAGVPVKGIDLEHIERFYLSDVMLNDDGELETIGTDGLVGAPVCTGDTPKEAAEGCYKVIKELQIPNCQYRDDIAEACQKRYDTLESQGWLKAEKAANA
jgi:phosphoribosylamine--glycine ligase